MHQTWKVMGINSNSQVRKTGGFNTDALTEGGTPAGYA